MRFWIYWPLAFVLLSTAQAEYHFSHRWFVAGALDTIFGLLFLAIMIYQTEQAVRSKKVTNNRTTNIYNVSPALLAQLIKALKEVK